MTPLFLHIPKIHKHIMPKVTCTARFKAALFITPRIENNPLHGWNVFSKLEMQSENKWVWKPKRMRFRVRILKSPIIHWLILQMYTTTKAWSVPSKDRIWGPSHMSGRTQVLAPSPAISHDTHYQKSEANSRSQSQTYDSNSGTPICLPSFISTQKSL